MKDTICLIACSEKKATQPCAARDMYKGLLFQKSVAFAESRGYQWFVLSAKYGLVNPDDLIAPYDWKLTKTVSHFAIEEWRSKVLRKLSLYVDLEFNHRPSPQTIIFLAGKDYKTPLINELKHYKLDLQEPLKGLGYGQQVRWLMDNTVAKESAK